MKNKIVFIIFFIVTNGSFFAQTPLINKQNKLEKERIRLRNEIKQINNLLFENKRVRKSTLSEVEDIELKISVRKQLIKVNNEQANFLNNLININQRDIDKYRSELKKIKNKYALMIKKSYKSKSMQNRLMFIFSSENFRQAYKRLDYLKQYNAFRKKQAIKIKNQTINLQNLNKNLILKQKQKQILVYENRSVKNQVQAASIDAKIEKLIKEAIAFSNKKAGKKSSKIFSLTPEAKILAQNFRLNKGQLPWPVFKGIVVQKYGTQTHPVVKTTQIKSSGVSIATDLNAEVRVVFEGEVMSVLVFKNSNPTVLVKHGNYITAYKNLSKVFVKKGQKVSFKEVLGEVFTNKETGKTILQFSIFNGLKSENPSFWLYNM